MTAAPQLLAVAFLATGLLTRLTAGAAGSDWNGLAPSPEARAAQEEYGIGRDATEDEIKAWDIDIMPDGAGLPPGRGTVARGAVVYTERCAFCHGNEGQGVPAITTEVLIRQQPWFELGNPRQLGSRTIGNYWPYATTLFDYTRRAMPFDSPGSLNDDDVYSVVAWLLNQNGVIAEGAVMDAQTLPAVRMPGRDLFVPDPRPDQL